MPRAGRVTPPNCGTSRILSQTQRWGTKFSDACGLLIVPVQDRGPTMPVRGRNACMQLKNAGGATSAPEMVYRLTEVM